MLKNIAPSNSNILPTRHAYVWNLSLDEIEPGTGRLLTKSRCKVSELGSAKCSFDSRHVLYSKLRPYLNKVVLPDEPGVGTSELIPLLPDPARLDREYLAHYLRSGTFLDYARAHTRGANLPRIAMEALWSHQIRYPLCLHEQRRIVAGIKKCMERVEEIEGLQADLKREAGQVTTAFRHDLWSECEAAYDCVPLGSVAESTKNGLYKPRQFHSSGTVLIRMFNIIDATFDVTRIERVQTTAHEASCYQIKNGDIIVSRVNSRELVGKSCLVQGLSESAVHEAMLIRLRARRDLIDPHFLVSLMNSPQFLHKLRGRGKHAIGQSSINQKDLLSSEIPLPPLRNQEEIIDRIERLLPSAGALDSEIHEQLKPTQFLREAILRRAFAGEL